MSDYSKANLINSVNRIFKADLVDIACDQAVDEMIRVGGSHEGGLLTLAQVQRDYPLLWQHLDTCSTCLGEFKLILELINRDLEQTDQAQLKIRPRPDQSSLFQQTTQWVERQIGFPGFGRAAVEPTRGYGSHLNRVKIEIDPELLIEIDPAVSAVDPSKRDIYFSLISQNPQIDEADFEGIEVSAILKDDDLSQPDREEVLSRTEIDQMGDSTLQGLDPSQPFSIVFQIKEIRYYIRGISFDPKR